MTRPAAVWIRALRLRAVFHSERFKALRSNCRSCPHPNDPKSGLLGTPTTRRPSAEWKVPFLQCFTARVNSCPSRPSLKMNRYR